jgi:hypothetical protein
LGPIPPPCMLEAVSIDHGRRQASGCGPRAGPFRRSAGVRLLARGGSTSTAGDGH